MDKERMKPAGNTYWLDILLRFLQCCDIIGWRKKSQNSRNFQRLNTAERMLANNIIWLYLYSLAHISSRMPSLEVALTNSATFPPLQLWTFTYKFDLWTWTRVSRSISRPNTWVKDHLIQTHKHWTNSSTRRTKLVTKTTLQSIHVCTITAAITVLQIIWTMYLLIEVLVHGRV